LRVWVFRVWGFWSRLWALVLLVKSRSEGLGFPRFWILGGVPGCALKTSVYILGPFSAIRCALYSCKGCLTMGDYVPFLVRACTPDRVPVTKTSRSRNRSSAIPQISLLPSRAPHSGDDVEKKSIFRCLEVHRQLGEVPLFREHYRDCRRTQSKLDHTPPATELSRHLRWLKSRWRMHAC